MERNNNGSREDGKQEQQQGRFQQSHGDSQSNASRLPDLHRLLAEQLIQQQQPRPPPQTAPNLQFLVQQLLQQTQQLPVYNPAIGSLAYNPSTHSPAGASNTGSGGPAALQAALASLSQHQNTHPAGMPALSFPGNNIAFPPSRAEARPGGAGNVAALLNQLLSGSHAAVGAAGAPHESSPKSDSSDSNSGSDRIHQAHRPGTASTIAYRQQQQLLELSSNDTSSSSSETLLLRQQRQYDPSGNSHNHYFFPCRARAVPPDHNSKTAVLKIPQNVKHGQGLVCSHEGCQRKGIKFLYCIVCKTPVAKANFGNRHKHGEKRECAKLSSSSKPRETQGGKSTNKQGSPIAMQSLSKEAGDGVGSRKRGRPPDVISINPKERRQEKATEEGKVEESHLTKLPPVTSGNENHDEDGPTTTDSQKVTPKEVDWNSIMSGGHRRLSSSERLDLWRFMLENRPSPGSSPAQISENAYNVATSTAGNPRALSEWMDRILWLSDPEVWSKQETSDFPSSSKMVAGVEKEEVKPKII